MAPYPASQRRIVGHAALCDDHTSKATSSLLVVGDVADDVGDIVLSFFFLGDEGRIVVIVLDGLVGLDIIDRFGNVSLGAAGRLGIRLLERHGLDLCYHRLRWGNLSGGATAV